MNLSSLINRKNSFVVLCLSLLFYSFGPFNNTKNDPFTEECKNADAYLLHSYQDVTYTRRWARYNRNVSVSNKIVVNNSNGVDKYAFLNLSEYISNHLKSISVKTLKADGTVVELDSSTVFKRDPKSKRFSEINYPIPAVEPGDTIETNFVYYENLQKSELMNYVDLYADIPILDSQYTIYTGQDLVVRYKAYNNFPEPSVVTNDTLVYVRFTMDKVKGVTLNDNYCLPCEKPYVYYALEKRDDDLKTWKDVYNEEFNFLTQPIALDYERSSYYKRWKRRVLGTAKDSSKYYQLELLHSEVVNNFKIDAPIESEIIKSTGYFLKEERFDTYSIRRFYRQILEDLDINYWAVFGRTKNLGPIDTQLIRYGEFGHIFFAYENENGNLKFLYPHEEFYKYLIDELPTKLYNTNAVIAKPIIEGKKKKRDKFINRDLQMAEVDSVDVRVIKLPGMNPNQNYINQTVFANVDLEEEKTTFKFRFNVSGGASTELRSFFDMLDQNKDMGEFYDALWEYEGDDNTLQIDTLTSNSLSGRKPFTYVMNSEGTINNAVKFINDSLVSISIDKLIQHNKIDNSTEESELSYYLDYSYSDIFMFNLQFPCKIEVLGMENADVDYKSDSGQYYFEFRQNQENQLSFRSIYKILKDLIPNSELSNLKAQNDMLKAVKNKRLLVKLKGIE